MLQFFSRAPALLAFLPPPPLLFFAPDLNRKLAAAALSGMVISTLLVLHLNHYLANRPSHCGILYMCIDCFKNSATISSDDAAAALSS
jgi:hypothetical protein